MKRVLCLFLFLFLSTAASAQSLNLLRDEEIERGLKTMSRPIFEAAGLSPASVRFIIVNAGSLNAFVAGGQNIFLHTGLILKAENPEELLGVIAHETGHISSGHLYRGKEEASGLSLQATLANILGIAIAVGAREPGAAVAVGSAASSVALRSLLRHTRTQEGSADQSGVRFLRDSGLPLSGFVSFMKKLESQELLPESQQSEYVQTHPLTQDRVSALESAASATPGGHIPPEWRELHARMRAKLQGYLFPDQALLNKDESFATRYGRTIALFRKGETDKALAAVDALIREEPKNPYLQEFKGQVLFENGRIDAALDPYARAVTLAPEAGLIRVAYAQALLESRIGTAEKARLAITQLEAARLSEPLIAEPHRLMSIAYGRLGNEGLSRLHLAEEALMQNRKEFARREAQIALTKLKKGTPSSLRAEDIVAATDDIDTKNKKRGGRP